MNRPVIPKTDALYSWATLAYLKLLYHELVGVTIQLKLLKLANFKIYKFFANFYNFVNRFVKR